MTSRMMLDSLCRGDIFRFTFCGVNAIAMAHSACDYRDVYAEACDCCMCICLTASRLPVMALTPSATLVVAFLVPNCHFASLSLPRFRCQACLHVFFWPTCTSLSLSACLPVSARPCLLVSFRPAWICLPPCLCQATSAFWTVGANN